MGKAVAFHAYLVVFVYVSIRNVSRYVGNACVCYIFLIWLVDVLWAGVRFVVASKGFIWFSAAYVYHSGDYRKLVNGISVGV